MAKKRHQNNREMERFILFTDAVVAIAITLLVAEIKVPVVENLATVKHALEFLAEIKYEALGFIISFMVISNFWMVHLKIFSRIKEYTNSLIELNLFFLFLILLISFFTSFLVAYPGNIITVIMYSILIMGIAILQIGIIEHIIKFELTLESNIRKSQKNRNSLLIIIIVFGISIIIALFNGVYAMYFWLILIPIFLINKILDKSETIAEEEIVEEIMID